METEEIMGKIDEILLTSKFGTLSTEAEHPTDSTFMTFHINDYNLYTEADKHSSMMKDIQHDPFVHVILGNNTESYLEITGKAEVVEDDRVIEWIGESQDKAGLNPNKSVLKILVLKVKLMNESEDSRNIDTRSAK